LLEEGYMKLVLFDDFRPGVLKDGHVVDVSAATVGLGVTNHRKLMPAIIEHWDRLRPEIERIAAGERGRPLGEVRLRAPDPFPPKLIACFSNYQDSPHPDRPPQDMFLKSNEGVIGDGDTVELPPHAAKVFHHEAELGVVIGRKSRNLALSDSMAAIFGYTCFVDVSARGLTIAGTNSRMGKSFDGFGPMGPCITTADEIPDPNSLQVRFWDDELLRQNYNTSTMEYKVPEVVQFASQYMTLLPGDFICCGTNHLGLGPLQDGEYVEMEIERIGKFGFHISDPHGRTWPKGIDTTANNPVVRAGGRPGEDQGAQR
jgi:2-keto-4-pentenoate hydratase/2-oxohepta-3-ene-1,7-dioic acid hydratase in catechol pathway